MVTLVTWFEVLAPVGLLGVCAAVMAGVLWWVVWEDTDE